MENFKPADFNQVLPMIAQEAAVTQDREDRAFAYVDKVFAELKAIFPVSFAQFTKSDEQAAKAVWTKAFIEAKLAPRMIDGGLSIARTQEKPFLPSPGLFISWCLKAQLEQLNIIDAQGLFDLMRRFAASRGLDNHNNFDYGSDLNYWLVHELYREMIARDLRTHETKQLAQDLLDEVSKKLIDGWQPPKQIKAIEKTETKKYCTQEEGLAYLEEIKKLIKRA